MGLFQKALTEMAKKGRYTYGPVSFQGYLKEHNLKAKTAPVISVDRLGGLKKDLLEAETMVFRLGSPKEDKHTHFALARCMTGWSDYFLKDDEIFRDIQTELFIPPVSLRKLFAFYLLPKFTETSLVNLALTSGLLSYALQIDNEDLPSAPATGQSTYSFRVRPHQEIDVSWHHHKGQVEIDAVFSARRSGKETLFVIEAKAGVLDSLAKHKLLYPVLSLRPQIPSYMGIVPVYLRAIHRADGIHYYVAECTYEVDAENGIPLNTLRPKTVRHLVLSGLSSGLS